jgi:hypothetical protein
LQELVLFLEWLTALTFFKFVYGLLGFSGMIIAIKTNEIGIVRNV